MRLNDWKAQAEEYRDLDRAVQERLERGMNRHAELNAKLQADPTLGPRLVEALQQDAEQVYAILCSDAGGDIPDRIIAATEHVAKWRDLLKELGE